MHDPSIVVMIAFGSPLIRALALVHVDEARFAHRRIH